jgi:hypothetical protein
MAEVNVAEYWQPSEVWLAGEDLLQHSTAQTAGPLKAADEQAANGRGIWLLQQ